MPWKRRLGAAWCGAVVIAVTLSLAGVTPVAQAAVTAPSRAVALVVPATKVKTYPAPTSVKAKASAAGSDAIALTCS